MTAMQRLTAENFELARIAAAGPIVLYALALTFAPLTPGVSAPDTIGYIEFNPMRTAFYPMVVQALGGAESGYSLLFFFQLWVFAFAAAFLADAMLRFTGSALITCGFVLLLLANPYVATFHFVILTESLFISCLCVAAGCMLRLLTAPWWLWFVLLGAAVGVAIGLRPVGYAFAPMIPIVAAAVALLRRAPVLANMALSLAVAGLLIALETAVFHAHHEERVSVLPLHISAKAAMVEAGPSPYPAADPRGAAWRALETDGAPVRALLEAAPVFDVRSNLLNSYEWYFQWLYPRDVFARAAAEAGVATDALTLEVGLDRMRAAPLDTLRLAAWEYRMMWQVDGHAASPGAVAAFYEAHAPLPHDDAGGLLAPDTERTARRAAQLVQIGLITGFFVSLLVLPLAAYGVWVGAPWRDFAVMASLMSLMIHGKYLLVVMIAIGESRYALAMWPAMAIIAALVAQIGLSALRSRRVGGPAPKTV